MSPLLVLVLTTIVNVFLLGLLLFKDKSNTSKTAVNYFIASVVLLLLWSVFNYLADISLNETQALFWTRLTFFPGLLSCLSLVYFSFHFPNKINKEGLVPYIAGLLTTVSLLLISSSYAIKSVAIAEGGGVVAVEVGLVYAFVVLTLIYLLGQATTNFYGKYKKSLGKIKRQLMFVLLGWGSFLSIAIFTNALLPLLTGDTSWSKFGPLGSVFMVSLITYAIIKHSLFDIRIIIQRGLIYSVLFSLSLAIYVGLLFVVERLFSRGVEVDAVVSAFLTALLAIVSASPLEKLFKKVTDPFFFKDTYDYGVVLSELADILNRNLSKNVIIKKSTEVINKTFHPERLNLYLGNKVKISYEPALTLPILNKHKQIGVLLLGAKKSGDDYTEQDILLLQTFAVQAAVALEKARLYEEVKDYASTLEKKVEERTVEIVELQKEQESMMHELSHGLQTPLTIMKGELYFLRKQGYETAKIDAIDSSINRISYFINKMLSLYRLDSSVVTSRKIGLKTMLESVALGFAEQFAKHQFTYEVVASKEVVIMGDGDALEEVISNLVSNAIKYSKPDTQNKLTLGLASTNNEAIITVSDTGLGIPKDSQDKLFTKFYRVRGEDTRNIEGTGLGLVIAKKVVERHGGTIKVESEHGVGTTFIITLPKSQ